MLLSVGAALTVPPWGELSDDELDAVAGGGCGAVEDAKNSTSVPPSAGLVATNMNVCG